METIKDLSDKLQLLLRNETKAKKMYDITRQETRAEKVAAIITSQEKAFKNKTREKTGVSIHGQPCKFTFLWINGGFYTSVYIDSTVFCKQLLTIRAKLPAVWLLNIAEKAVKHALKQQRAGQSVKIRTTEKPQNPHNF